MPNSSSAVSNELERTRARFEVLQELDMLESEFRLIENEYTQGKRFLEERLKALNQG